MSWQRGGGLKFPSITDGLCGMVSCQVLVFTMCPSFNTSRMYL